MIDLNGAMEFLERDGLKVRLYHAVDLKLWVAQTFENDWATKAKAHGSAATPEGALQALLFVCGGGESGEVVLRLCEALNALRKTLDQFERRQAWAGIR